MTHLPQDSVEPLVTIAVPSYNQGRYLDEALRSVLSQELPVEVFVMDGGSADGSVRVIENWAPRLAGWRSHPDRGQSAAINEGIAQGRAPYVCWLNSDDLMLEGGLRTLLKALESAPGASAVYGRTWNQVETSGRRHATWVEPFDFERLALRCIVSQPATLIRRSAWEAVGGLDESLHMTMDYDLWWRLARHEGGLRFVDSYVAVNRIHPHTKTGLNRRRHYQEAIRVVRHHHGRVPWKWWLAQPYAVWLKSVIGRWRE